MEEVNTKGDEGEINEDKSGETSSPHEKNQGIEENPRGWQEPTRQSQRVRTTGCRGSRLQIKLCWLHKK
jgi:hypothetical protein